MILFTIGIVIGFALALVVAHFLGNEEETDQYRWGCDDCSLLITSNDMEMLDEAVTKHQQEVHAA